MKIALDDCENFDGIVEKIEIDNAKKSVTIEIKQWKINETHCLSILKFNEVVFQSLPDVSSFNLVREIVKKENTNSVLDQFSKYLENNPTLVLSNTKENISSNIKGKENIESYLFESGYCKDWLIICGKMILSEIKNKQN